MRNKPASSISFSPNSAFGHPEGHVRFRERRHGKLMTDMGEERTRCDQPSTGICLYSVLSHLGWDDNRYCRNGLFELETRQDRRVVHTPLAAELQWQEALFGALFKVTERQRLPAKCVSPRR